MRGRPASIWAWIREIRGRLVFTSGSGLTASVPIARCSPATCRKNRCSAQTMRWGPCADGAGLRRSDCRVILLGIDTSAAISSAIIRDDEVLSATSVHAPRRHAEILSTLVSHLIDESGV